MCVSYPVHTRKGVHLPEISPALLENNLYDQVAHLLYTDPKMSIEKAMVKVGYSPSYARSGYQDMLRNENSALRKALDKYANGRIDIARIHQKVGAATGVDLELRAVKALSKKGDNQLLKELPKYAKTIQSLKLGANLIAPEGGTTYVQINTASLVLGNVLNQTAVNPPPNGGAIKVLQGDKDDKANDIK